MAYYQNNYPYNTYQQIQNGGFVRVMNEQEARNYPVAPGYSVTFIDDSSSYCYTKAAGFSQFDKPIFKKYRLIAENEPQSDSKVEGDIDIPPRPEYALKSDFDKLRAEFKKLKSKVEKDND